jgi:hypothetical protein
MPNQLKESYSDLRELAQDLRDSEKKNTIIFAHNGVGKTSLSVEFKNIAKENGSGDTLYYNAFTEDLFYWDNDLENDEERVLMFRRESNFFNGLDANEMETRIRAILGRYSDFDFSIKLDVVKQDDQGNDYTINYVTFKRMEYNEETNRTEWKEDIKISRGEENIFKWCFFLAVAQMAIDKAEAYNWVKYIYVDDPISSLDDDNAVLVANHLASMIKSEANKLYTIISTHHGLFYNVIYNELGKNARKIYLFKEKQVKEDVTQQSTIVWKVKDLSDTPFFHHVAIIKELNKAVSPEGRLYTYHFNMLRNLLEKTAAFHGFDKFGDCIKKFDNDPDEQLYSRIINILSHGNYSLFEPVEMNEENKTYFRRIYYDFKTQFPFNENL